MVTNSMQSCFLIGNPLKHDTVFAINRKTEEASIFPVQFVHFKSSVIASVSEQLYLLERDLLQLRW